MLESVFKRQLKKKLKKLLPGCIVFHTDPNDIQGLPDLIVLYKNYWGALEGKKEEHSPRQPNQQYYIDLMNKMSYAAFVYPENEEEVLYEIQVAFGIGRPTRLSRSK